jgi:hypothetical protein
VASEEAMISQIWHLKHKHTEKRQISWTSSKLQTSVLQKILSREWKDNCDSQPCLQFDWAERCLGDQQARCVWGQLQRGVNRGEVPPWVCGWHHSIGWRPRWNKRRKRESLSAGLFFCLSVSPSLSLFLSLLFPGFMVWAALSYLPHMIDWYLWNRDPK